jgi:hypothetical protein
MADSKISALTAITALGGTEEFAVALSGVSNKITAANVQKFMPGFEYDYVERTTALTVSATTAAGANVFIDGNAVTYDGSTRIKVECFAPYFQGNNFIAVSLWDGSTDLGSVAQSNVNSPVPCYGVRFVTPSAASHTFHFKAWRGTTSGEVNADVGGAGTRVPGFLRITRA